MRNNSFDRLYDEISEGLLSLFGPWSEEVESLEWTFDGELTLLQARNMTGSIVVRGGDVDTIFISAVKTVRGPTEDAATHFARRVRVQAGRRDTAAYTYAAYPRPFLGCGVFVRYEITVPRAIDVQLYTQSGGLAIAGIEGAVEAETRGGNIELTDTVGPAQLYTAAGAIRISGVEGSVDAESGNGSVLLRRSKGRSRLRTTSGAVTISESMGIIEARNYSGDINLYRGRGGAQIETVEGDIRAAFQRIVEPVSLLTHTGSVLMDVLISDAQIEAESYEGDVQIALSSDFSGRLDAGTAEGGVVCGLPFVATGALPEAMPGDTDLLAEESSSDARPGSRALVGRLGSGGPTLVKLRSLRGDISVTARDV